MEGSSAGSGGVAELEGGGGLEQLPCESALDGRERISVDSFSFASACLSLSPFGVQLNTNHQRPLVGQQPLAPSSVGNRGMERGCREWTERQGQSHLGELMPTGTPASNNPLRLMVRSPSVKVPLLVLHASDPPRHPHVSASKRLTTETGTLAAPWQIQQRLGARPDCPEQHSELASRVAGSPGPPSPRIEHAIPIAAQRALRKP